MARWLLPLLLLLLTLPGCGESEANRILREERDASRATYEQMQEAVDAEDVGRLEALMRQREAHLRHRIEEVQGSSTLTGEDKNRVVEPMLQEQQSLQEGIEMLDRL